MMSNPGQTTHGVLTQYLITDLGGVTRGRGAWDTSDAPLKASMGWVPVNQFITPFDSIAPNPYGSHGDVRLRPDLPTLTDITLPSGRRLRFVLSDLVDLDGTPSALCARSFLQSALEQLEARELQVLASFEQEFWLERAQGDRPTPGFSYQRFIRHEPLGTRIVQALSDAGLEPETFLPEFAPNQFEVTLSPAMGKTAADRAVASREIIRAAAFDADSSASFSPIRAPGGVGSGVHIHLSLWSLDGRPVLHEAGAPGGLSRLGAAFAAGVVRHMRAICAFGAPCPLSYERLKPHRWSSAYTCMGDKNREATLRICPTVSGGRPTAEQFNLEYRAVDATANPYLILGALIHAGLAGIKSDLPLPPLIDHDPSTLSDDELAARGIRRLPTSLPEALLALRDDEAASSWMKRELLDAYLAEKEHEISETEALSVEDLTARYGAIY